MTTNIPRLLSALYVQIGSSSSSFPCSARDSTAAAKKECAVQLEQPVWETNK